MNASQSLTRAAARLAGIAGPSDAELLDRFVAGRDGDAFALLVDRHGPMVLGVCRRVLGNGPDADDAFQAAFLVLVRRAAALRDRGRLAGWLYGVAYRTSLEARTVRARRLRREPPTHPVPDVPAPLAVEPPEAGPALERELARLPEKLRTAIALCDLDGRPRAEAATLLGVPEGTLSSRLAAGRRLLARRLARFGPAALAVPAIPVFLPPGAAAAILDGGTPAARALAQGVSSAMLVAKLRLLLVVPAVAAAIALGSLGLRADPPPVTAAAAAAPEAPAPAAAENTTVKDAPPVIVKTAPQAGTDDVDPATKEIRVTFSKEMADGSWSWSTAGDFGHFPKDGGAIRYDKDKKTCILPVKLEPGKTYAIWVNSERFGNFKDADGRSAVPYLLVFQTKMK